jgi:hypothetical protein
MIENTLRSIMECLVFFAEEIIKSTKKYGKTIGQIYLYGIIA